MDISVIIPTYKCLDKLSKCLEALNNQTYSKEKFEIIVVNNGDEDDFPNDFLVPSNCCVIHEKTPGSYAARNAGILVAKGAVLAFTDADCLPTPTWIECGLKTLKRDPSATRMGGGIRLAKTGGKFEHKAFCYEKIEAYNQKALSKRGLAMTANLFAYRSVFDSVGLFNASLKSGGDITWAKIAEESGFKLIFSDEVIVEHPMRNSTALTQKELRVVGGYFDQVRHENILIKLRMFVKVIKPPVLGTFRILSSPDFKTLDKIGALGILYNLRIAGVFEFIRLFFGSESRRE